MVKLMQNSVCCNGRADVHCPRKVIIFCDFSKELYSSQMIKFGRYDPNINWKTGAEKKLAGLIFRDGVPYSLKKISVMHVIKLGFAPVSFPPG